MEVEGHVRIEYCYPWRWLEALDQDEVRHPKSANPGSFGWVLLRAQLFEEI